MLEFFSFLLQATYLYDFHCPQRSAGVRYSHLTNHFHYRTKTESGSLPIFLIDSFDLVCTWNSFENITLQRKVSLEQIV